MRLKKSVRRVLILILILLIMTLGGIIYYYGFYNTPVKEIKVIKEIPEYGYKLRENESGLYKKNFQKLEEILSKDEVDEEAYAKTLAKLFTIDFFSLNNKVAKTDVGGAEFVGETALDNFLVKAKDTYYKYLESDIYGDRKQNLPEVSKVKVDSITKEPFTYGDQTDDNAYKIKISWDYRNNQKGYQKEAELILVHQDKKLVLVELNKVSKS